MPVVGMNHFTVLAGDLDAAKAFYIDVLGLADGPRPGFPFPGAWLYADGAPILHLVAGREVPDPPEGVLDHIAFTARDLAGTIRRLETAGIRYDLRRIKASGAWQLFCFDPSGARVELDFDANETAS